MAISLLLVEACAEAPRQRGLDGGEQQHGDEHDREGGSGPVVGNMAALSSRVPVAWNGSSPVAAHRTGLHRRREHPHAGRRVRSDRWSGPRPTASADTTPQVPPANSGASRLRAEGTSTCPAEAGDTHPKAGTRASSPVAVVPVRRTAAAAAGRRVRSLLRHSPALPGRTHPIIRLCERHSVPVLADRACIGAGSRRPRWSNGSRTRTSS